MADELDGLNERMLRGMLPALYAKAKEGDTRAIDTVLRILQRLERNLGAGPAKGDGFTAAANAPGQMESRESKVAFEGLLEGGSSGDVARDEGVSALREAYFRQVEMGNNEGKWDWRKQAYIAWACVPKSKRWPRTEQEFASLIGLSNTATIRKWKINDPEIGERIAALPKALLANHVADVLEAMVTVASDPIPQATAERKLFLEIAGVYNPKGSIDMKGLMGTVTLDEVLDDEEQAKVEAMMRGLAAGKG